MYKIIKVNYKTAWYMAYRIRLAMQKDEGFCQRFSDVCEVDETYVGGKGKRGRGAANKIPVVSIKERTSSKIRLKAVKNVKETTLAVFLRKHITPGTESYRQIYMAQ